MKERLATLISGSGTTMQEIIKACQSGEIPMDVACVIVSNPNAGGIDKALRLGIPQQDIVIIDPNEFRKADKKIDQGSFGLKILTELQERGVTVVTQNGWLPLTPENVIDQYQGKIFNQHPGPVPEFGGQGMYGRRVHAARLIFVRETKRDYWTEVIAQKVAVNYDEGVVVKSAQVPILPSDTVDDLQARVLPIEHKVQIAMLQDFAAGTLKEQAQQTLLIRPGEEETLLLAKRLAIMLYPHG